MFTLSPPRFKAINSNLMMLSLQVGNFLGPVIGAWLMHGMGYDGMLLVTAGCCLLGAGLCLLLTTRRLGDGGTAAQA